MNNSEEFMLIAKTFEGIEGLLAQELEALGAKDIKQGRRVVSFVGDKRLMYKANFCLRTAIKILKPIKTFTATNADEVYEAIKDFVWEDYLDVNTSFAVDAVVYSSEFHHSKFVAYRVKDAIADYFRTKYGKRPSVKISNPDLQLHIHISDTVCTLSLDSSGESLHRRGYRQESVEAPLNEVLAAAMVMLTGWKGECDLVDPMCGSGTILIEAALIAKNIAPGIFRKGFAFEKWKDFDQEMFDDIASDDSQEKEFEHKIYGFDNNPTACVISRANAKAACLSKFIEIKMREMSDFEWEEGHKALMITNPPYGERLKSDTLLDLYKCIGERLKHAFCGNEAWILSYKEECFDEIGLRPSESINLYNGELECKFKKYSLFSGKLKERPDNLPAREDKDTLRSCENRGERDRERRGFRAEGRERRGGFDRGFDREQRFGRERRNDRDGEPGRERRFGSGRERGDREEKKLEFQVWSPEDEKPRKTE